MRGLKISLKWLEILRRQKIRRPHEEIRIQKDGEWYFTNWDEIEHFYFSRRLDKSPGSPPRIGSSFWAGAFIESEPSEGRPPGEHYGHWASFKFHQDHLLELVSSLMEGYNSMVQNVRKKQKEKSQIQEWKKWREIYNLRIYIQKGTPDPIRASELPKIPLKIDYDIFKLEHVGEA